MIILSNNNYYKSILNIETKDSFYLKSEVHFIHLDLLDYMANILVFINLILIYLIHLLQCPILISRGNTASA